MTGLSDSLLLAYADGQLPPEQADAIARLLANDPETARRVAALQATHERLSAAFQAMLATQETWDLEDICPSPLQWKRASPAAEAENPAETASPDGAKGRRRSAPLWKKHALAAGLLCLGSVLGAAGAYWWGISQLKPVTPQQPETTASLPAKGSGEIRVLADYQSLLGREFLETSLESLGNLDLAQFLVTSALGRPVVIPDFSQNNLEFRRLQLLSQDGAPLVQILYLPEDGPPVSLFLKKDRNPRPMEEMSRGGVNLMQWGDGKLRYILAGRLPRWELAVLAVSARRQMTEKP